MALIIRTPTPDPNIHYQGKTFPKDRGQSRDTTDIPDPKIPYAGAYYPDSKKTYTPFVDNFNTPGVIILGSTTAQTTLPPDSLIHVLKAEKHLVMTTILDGVSVFEHINRKPYKIEIEGTFRMQNKGGTTYNNTTPPAGAAGPINNVFAQQYLNATWTNVWLPDTVLTVSNSYLNGLGIQQIVVESFHTSLKRGSKDIGFVLQAFENVPGQSLIIS